MVQGNQTFNAMENSSIELPDSSAFADMEMSRDGQDLVLQSDNGQDIVIENYFTAEPQPILEASDGSVLTPELVSAFVQSPEQLAQIETAAGTEPVGAIEELHGDATVTRADGSSEPVTLGTPIYQGDVVETSADGGVNILFIDETSMALSEGARFAVTDYSFDAQTESGTTNFSVLRGVFVFTSGLIGRDDPDDVTIDTPVGSIGIRGTIIAGHINPEGESSISVVEGAIVVKNGAGERTLSQQFETIQVDGFNSEMQDMGVLEPAAVTQAYGSASYVIPSLFSNINDAAKEQAAEEEQQQAEEALEAVEEVKEEIIEEPAEEALEQKEIMMEQPLEMQQIQVNDQEILEQKEQQHKQQQKEQQQKNDELRKVELQNPDTIDGQGNQKISFDIKHEFSELDAVNGGGVAARLTGAPTDINFTFNDNGTKFSADGNFQIIGNQVHYIGTALPSMNADDLDPFPGTDYVIKATNPKGQVVLKEFNPVIHDVAVNLHGGGEFNPAFEGKTNLGNMNNDANNHDDYALINGDGNVVISDALNIGTLHTTTGGGYTSIAALGDINNDGFDDAIAGKPTNAGGGAVNIIDGATSGIIDDIPMPPGTVATGDNYGFSVAGIGDFDGDGTLDYIVGAPDTDNTATNDGSAYIHSSLHGELEIVGTTSNQKIGLFVDGAGDINGDGFSDVLISGSNKYEAYTFLGDRSQGADIDNADLTINTGANEIISGAGIGDFNGDGFDDIAISVTNDDTVDGNAQTYVLFGGAGSTASADFTITIDELEDPNIAFKINDIDGYNASAGDYTVRSVGDLNGDGFDDIEIGSSATGFHVIHGEAAGAASYFSNGMGGAVNYVSDGGAGDASNAENHVRASEHGQALINSVDFVDGDKFDISMNGNNADNKFRINNDDFRNIDGGAGTDTISFGATGGSGSLDLSGITYEQISGVDKLYFAKDSGGLSGNTISLTVENIFNLLKTSDSGEFKIDLQSGATGNLNIISGTDHADTVAGIETALEQNTSEDVTHSVEGNFDKFTIGGYSLYIEQTINTDVVA